ncbi:MAG: hypothetical protein RL477_2230 [Pseudomonadota bacterium]
MNGDSGSERADLAFLAEGVKRQRRIAREIMADSEAIGRLLDSDTSALGSDEVNFHKRMREQLLARAEDLNDNANDTAAREPRARRGAARAPAPEVAASAPREAPAPQGPATQGPTTERRGAEDLARVVVVCYLMFLFAFMGYLFAKSHLMRVDVTGDIIEMFKVFLLPTVMLVLGFFFGSSRR